MQAAAGRASWMHQTPHSAGTLWPSASVTTSANGAARIMASASGESKSRAIIKEGILRLWCLLLPRSRRKIPQPC